MRVVRCLLAVALAAMVGCASDGTTTITSDGPAVRVVTPPPAGDAELPTGRAVLAAAQGEPHALWFWGAH